MLFRRFCPLGRRL